MRVMSAGDGYKYLMRTIAAADGDRVTDLYIRVERLTALGRDDFLL